jgi:uncharacterized membrane protein
MTEALFPYWSWLLTAVGVLGLYLAGRRKTYGWAIGIGAQALWIAYATATHQYGFYLSAIAYGWVYLLNLRRWRQTDHPIPTPALPATTHDTE